MITITDRSAYDRYRQAFMPILRAHGGTLLAVDEAPAIEEGDWPYDKMILLSFEDEAAFRRWKDSPEYRKIAKDRHAGSNGTIILAHAAEQR
jgi:uncharacterized protein (DUF1330 family)